MRFAASSSVPVVALLLVLLERGSGLVEEPQPRDRRFERKLALTAKDPRRILDSSSTSHRVLQDGAGFTTTAGSGTQEEEGGTSDNNNPDGNTEGEEKEQCGGPAAVANWIAGELERKTCEDLPLNPFTQPLCENYENIADITECQDVTQETVGISASGVPVGSTQEECQIFVAALAPNPYFRDVDSINHFFGTTFAFPKHYECKESTDELCELSVVYLTTDDPGQTNGPTPAPQTTTVPCTQCDFYYDDDQVCFSADCNKYQCNHGETTEPAPTSPPANETHQSIHHEPYHSLVNNVNSSLLSCMDLNQQNVTCEECLNAGCGAVEGECLGHCLFAPNDALCWADALFANANSSEICHFKAELEADAYICARSNITDCGTCTSTLKSDGVTHCEWYYQPNGESFCGRGGCNLAGNCGKKTCEAEQIAEDNTIGNGGVNPFCDEGECIGVCFQSYRSDLFSFQEHYVGNVYAGCFMQTEQKKWTTEFHFGSSNIRTLEFRIAEHRVVGGEDSDGNNEPPPEQNDELFDYCELRIDGEACQSCNFCNPTDTAELNIDCTNIVEDAKVSCGSVHDLYYGITHKLLVLEEGYTHAPTASPTEAPSAMPTRNPTTPPPGVEPNGPGDGSETNEIIGAAVVESGALGGTGGLKTAATMLVVMLVTWATGRAWN